MPRNAVAKIFDVESTFKTRGKETSEWCNERSEDGKYEQMKLIRNIGNNGYRTAKLQKNTTERRNRESWKSTHKLGEEAPQRCPHFPFFGKEDRVGSALDIAPYADTEVMHRADHVVELHEICAPKHAEDKGTPECTDEALNSFLRGKLDQRGATKGDPPDVCKHIVAND
jgi:hypothetical protein